jgi:hypothetical protein
MRVLIKYSIYRITERRASLCPLWNGRVQHLVQHRKDSTVFFFARTGSNFVSCAWKFARCGATAPKRHYNDIKTIEEDSEGTHEEGFVHNIGGVALRLHGLGTGPSHSTAARSAAIQSATRNSAAVKPTVH